MVNDSVHGDARNNTLSTFEFVNAATTVTKAKYHAAAPPTIEEEPDIRHANSKLPIPSKSCASPPTPARLCDGGESGHPLLCQLCALGGEQQHGDLDAVHLAQLQPPDEPRQRCVGRVAIGGQAARQQERLSAGAGPRL